jgi:hypothetical protein
MLSRIPVIWITANCDLRLLLPGARLGVMLPDRVCHPSAGRARDSRQDAGATIRFAEV